MALITSAASGNFNAGATWTGGVVPGIGDEARASNGHTITITASATCDLISNLGTGNFVITNGVTITANITSGSSTANTYVLRFSEASPAVAYVVGNVVYATTNSASGINNSGTGTLSLTGSVSPGGLGSNAFGANNTSSGSLIITGNCTGATWTNSLAVNNNTVGSVTITGNVIGGNNTGSPGVTNATTGPVTITGNVTGGAVSAGLVNNSTGTITVIGDLTASTLAHAVTSTNASAVVRLSGSFIYASNGLVPVNTTKFILLTTPNTAKTRYALNGTSTFVDMFTADNTGLAPAVGDVRAGVVYGSATGVLAVPAANSVAFGVPVDNTTGTAVLTPAAVWSYAARTTTGGTVDTLTNAPASVTPNDIWGYATRTLTTSSGPTAVEIRQEIDANSTKLDAAISSRLASASYTAPTTPPTAAEIATAVEGSLLNEADGQAVLNALVGAIGNQNVSEVSLVAAIRSDIERTGGKLDNVPTAAANASAVWGTASKQITGGTVDTLTNSPSVPSAASIASATRTELAVELARVDASVSSRMAGSESTKLDAVKVKTDALPIERLQNCATTAIVGNLIAQSQS